MSDDRSAGSATKLRDWWLRDRSTGEIRIGQPPNAAILVWLAATIVRWFGVWPKYDEELRWLGTGALVAWALDELARGVNPFRRLLGALVLGWQIVRLLG